MEMNTLTETRLGVTFGLALTVMGAMDYFRHQTGGAVATVLLIIEIVALVVGVGALFAWARQREKQKRRDSM